MPRRHWFFVAAVLLAWLGPQSAFADPPAEASAATTAAQEEKAEKEAIGFNIDVGLATAYLNRGRNLLGARQKDQHWFISPSITYSILDTGLSLGYWGAYQLNGANRKALVRAGAGHEQDFILGYEKSWLDETLTLETVLAAIIYPFATKKDAGTKNPAYLEPMVTLTYSTAVDLSLRLIYSAGLQNALKDCRYLYLHPTVSKTFKLDERVELTLALGYGYKLFNERKKMKENVHDVAIDLETKLQLSERFYLVPGFHAIWTNLPGLPFDEEYAFASSMNAGFDF